MTIDKYINQLIVEIKAAHRDEPDYTQITSSSPSDDFEEYGMEEWSNLSNFI